MRQCQVAPWVLCTLSLSLFSLNNSFFLVLNLLFSSAMPNVSLVRVETHRLRTLLQASQVARSTSFTVRLGSLFVCCCFSYRTRTQKACKKKKGGGRKTPTALTITSSHRTYTPRCNRRHCSTVTESWGEESKNLFSS